MHTNRRVAVAGLVAGIPLMALLGRGQLVKASVPAGQSGFLLGGNAQNAHDPENPANDVVAINTLAPPLYGTVSRVLNTQIQFLDNMLEFKSYFQNRSCGGGSPRIQLAIDLNGDGTSDGNAFAYTPPPFAGCAPNRWQYDDVTDELPRWDASQLAAFGFPSAAAICTNPLFSTNPVICPIGGFQTNSGYIPWIVFKTVLMTLFPNHRVCSGALIDDSGWLPAAAGVAYYDIISLGRATWEDSEDSVARGFAKGCGKTDDGDFEVPGDEDHDHCVTTDDQNWKSRHGGDE